MPSLTPEARAHEPVLLREVLALLDLEPGEIVVDGTLGRGGHALEISKRIGTKGRLIGIDQDPDAIQRAKQNLKAFSQADYIQGNFSELDGILKCLNLNAVDAVLLDVGISTEQLEEVSRGFSFLKEGPLDMRMDPGRALRARDLVNDLSQGELEKLFRTYGQERWARRIATNICRQRVKHPIETTGDLVRIVHQTVPRLRHKTWRGRHPATRVFQALRIRVNEELGALESALPKAFQALGSGGRLAVISFHSLEDRLVKQMFRAWAKEGKVRILTPKPVRPTEEEVQRNPRSRSAKLRAVERMDVEVKSRDKSLEEAE